MTGMEDWQAQVGRAWADMYRQTDRSFAPLTQHLLEHLSRLPGDAVLDVGCGAGELTLALARARPLARIIGIDVSADLIAAARKRAGERRHVSFLAADASVWRDAKFHPELIVSRHGVMFFPVPRTAFSRLRDMAAHGANLVFTCFRSPLENPWASELAGLLPGGPAIAESTAPGPFAFADSGLVRTILDDAGWAGVRIEPFDYAYVAGQGEDPVGDALAFFGRIGPAAQAMRGLDEEAREALEVRLRGWLEHHREGDIVAFPAAAWIVSAHNG